LEKLKKNKCEVCCPLQLFYVN